MNNQLIQRNNLLAVLITVANEKTIFKNSKVM